MMAQVIQMAAATEDNESVGSIPSSIKKPHAALCTQDGEVLVCCMFLCGTSSDIWGIWLVERFLSSKSDGRQFLAF